MKRKTTLSAALLAALLFGSPNAAQAQSYNFDGVRLTSLVDVFYQALQNGQKYPSDEAICSALNITRTDLEFIKSHVKRRDVINTEQNRLIQNTYHQRKLMMNTPMGSGAGGDAGYPTGGWHNDVFSLWNYTSLWGSWNHSLGQIPGSWTDAAHKNGCGMQGGTLFFDSAQSDNSAWSQWTSIGSQKDATQAAYNGYKYVKPVIHMLRYFGMDGININWEMGSPSQNRDFHANLYKYAKECGLDDFRVTVYVTSTSLTSSNKQMYYVTSSGDLHMDYLLNHAGSGTSATDLESLPSSAIVASQTKAGPDHLWKGIYIVAMSANWNLLHANEDAKKVNLYLWGEHKNSRFWSYNSGADAMEQQTNYQSTLERAFSGGNRNPLKRPSTDKASHEMTWKNGTPPLTTFAGFATWIPERSTITGNLPFGTNFNLGNGERYNYRGKFSAGAWYNMGAQDIVPTYRWLVLEQGQKVNESARTSNKIDVKFSHQDAYIGGSCLQLTGDATPGTDVVLYRTDITPNNADTYATIALKGGGDRPEGEVASHLSLILEVNNQWKEYKIENNKSRNWELHTVKLNLGPSDKITHVGLRVKGNESNYNMYVGELTINDSKKITPAAIKSLEAEKTNETTSTLDVKLRWEANIPTNEYGVAYNDEGNIDHFEILFKDGADGKVREVGRTSQWATFIPAIDIKNVAEPYIGVASVSKDLKTYSEVVWKRLEKRTDLEESPFGTYGQSSLNVNSEGFQTALRLRGVEKFKTTGATQDVDYQLTYEQFKAENNNGQAKYLNYHYEKDKVLKVRQGQIVNFTLKGFDGSTVNGGTSTDDLRYCFVGGWMDFDGSGTFNYGKGTVEQPFWLPNYQGSTNQETFQFDNSTKDGVDPMGERVFRFGSLRKGNLVFVKNDGVKGSFKVPEDAKRGKSRLRIVWSDAWFAGEFGPNSNTNKGYTLDIEVLIEGDNNQERGAKDLHDQGTPDDWTVVTDITEVENVAGEPSVKVKDGVLVFENTLKAEIYSPNGMMLKSVNRPHMVYGNKLVKGVYIIRLNGKKSVKVTL